MQRMVSAHFPFFLMVGASWKVKKCDVMLLGYRRQGKRQIPPDSLDIRGVMTKNPLTNSPNSPQIKKIFQKYRSMEREEIHKKKIS